MSLILEALKKSESRRRLGEAPDIGTPFTVKPRRRNPWPLIVIAITVAGGVGWWYAGTMPVSQPKDANTVVTLPSTPAAAPIGKSPVNAPQAGTQAAKAGPAPTARDSASVQAPARTEGSVPGLGAKPALRTDVAGPAAPGSSAADPRVPRPINQRLPQAAPGPANPNAPAAPAAIVPPPISRATPPPVPVAAAPAKPSTEPAVAAPVQQANVATAPPNATSAKPADVATAQPNAAPAKPADAIQMAPTASAAPAVPQYYELAYSVRKDIPQFNLSMHVFAADPAARFIVVDGERKVEGDAVKEGLVLREVRTDGIVLEFRGQRFFYPRPGH
jgi:general secretion pathway protein B